MGCTQSKEKEQEKPVDEPARQKEQDYSAAPAEAVDDVEVEAVEEASGEAPSKYKLGGPTVDGNVADLWSPYAYKVTTDDGWWVYSDTNQYEVHFTFTTGSDLEAGDCTRTEEGGKNVYEITVYPGETKQLWHGVPNGWSYKARASGLSQEYCARVAAEAEAAVSAQIDEMQAYVDNTGGDVDAAVGEIVANDGNYVDLDFKPTNASLGGQLRPAAWLRPKDFVPQEFRNRIRLISDGVEPNDIDQGRLGDCWFLCAVASVAEDPAKIKDIFRHPKRDAEAARAERARGAYRVTLNKGGWWYNLVVDDYLPCIGGQPCFARNVQDPAELWVALLEKAYARMHGSYAAIAAGDARQALSDLTGYPTERFPDFSEDPDGLFERIVQYDEKGYMINLNTPGHDDSDYMGKTGAGNSAAFAKRYKDAGLGMGHAYSVLVAKHFPEKGIRLVQIRNPWGNGTEWTGDWGDDSELWEKHPDIKAACNFTAEADGTFWMSWEDAREYFESGGVCFVERDWHDYRVKAQFNDARPSLVLEVRVTKPVTAYLVVSQRDRRGLPDDHPDRSYHSVMISVCEKDGETGRYASKRNSNWRRLEEPQESYGFCSARDVAMKVTFEPSDAPYLVVPRAHGSNAAPKDFTLAFISSEAVDGEAVSVNFRRPADDWRCFKNYTRFDYPETTEVSAEFQYNPEVGCPQTLYAPHIFAQE
uniref:Calpain catalytic domain-containing protein n=1 Tax=Neobodo designis TaxID=312471 RepID=A0A7S1R650_NEODS